MLKTFDLELMSELCKANISRSNHKKCMYDKNGYNYTEMIDV